MNKHGLMYLVGAGIQGSAVLFVTPIITRTLGPSEYGKVATAIIIIQMVATALAAGFPQLILRDYQRGEAGRRSARSLVGLMMSAALALAVAGCVVIAVLAACGVKGLLEPLTIALGAAGLASVVACQSLYRARECPLQFLLLAVGSTLGALVVGAFVAQASPTATTFLAAYMSTLAALALLSVFLAKPLWPWRVRVSATTVRSAIAMVPHGLAMLVLLSGDTVIVKATQGSANAGTYQAALTLGNIAFAAASAVYNAWGPAVYKHPERDRWRWMARSAVLIALGLTVVAALVVAVSPVLVAVIASKSFDRAAIEQLVGVLPWTAVAYVGYLGCSLVLIEHGRTGRLARLTSSTALLFAVAGVLGSQAFGLSWLAFAKVAAYILLFAVVFLASRRLERFSFRGWPAIVAVCGPVACLALAGAGGQLAILRIVAGGVAVLAAFAAWKQWRALDGASVERSVDAS